MPKSSTPSRRASGSRPRRAAPSRATMPAVKPRYTLPTARQARDVLIAELYRHGYGRTADAYARGEIREKQVASRVGCAAQRAEKRGERMRAKIARGVMLLASYLHEGKHTRDASGDALRVFWSHYERVHGEHGKYPLRENPARASTVVIPSHYESTYALRLSLATQKEGMRRGKRYCGPSAQDLLTELRKSGAKNIAEADAVFADLVALSILDPANWKR